MQLGHHVPMIWIWQLCSEFFYRAAKLTYIKIRKRKINTVVAGLEKSQWYDQAMQLSHFALHPGVVQVFLNNNFRWGFRRVVNSVEKKRCDPSKQESMNCCPFTAPSRYVISCWSQKSSGEVIVVLLEFTDRNIERWFISAKITSHLPSCRMQPEWKDRWTGIPVAR